MALHQKTLWTYHTRTGSSLDTTSPYGGLTAGSMYLADGVSRAMQGVRVYNSKNPNSPEDYSNLNALVAAIGGSQVTGLQGHGVTIEFDTSKSTDGTRGILKVDGLFDREIHYNDALTKGEAIRFMSPHGLDVYTWTGSGDVAAGASKNLLTLGDYTTDIAAGSTTIQANAFVALPVATRSRGVLLTVIIDGTYEGNGPHDFRVELRDAADSTVYQNAPLYGLTNNIRKVTTSFLLFTNGVHDEFSSTGYKISLVNDSQSKISVTGVKLVAQTISNPDFTVG